MPVIERVVKPKTHKGKQIILKREPKIIEDAKQTLFIKGLKTTDLVRNFMKDLYVLKKPNVQSLHERNDVHPFEDPTPLEQFGRKFNASLFVLVNNNKKRPNNLIMGRLFEHTIMDIVEFGVEDYQGLSSFKVDKISSDIKPMLVFQGELFESNHEYKRMKNLLVDMFQREPAEQIRLQGLEHVISFTAHDNSILFRSYKVALKKSGTKLPRIELVEIGPRANLRIRRSKLATDDLFKQACKKPKELKVIKKKNISEDNLGTTLGRIHMGAQKLNTIQTRKMKGLRKSLTERKLERKRKAEGAEADGATKKIKDTTQ